MRIAMIGTGYVGLVTGVCLSEQGHHVICVDKVHEKIEMLKRGQVPLYEPGLSDLMHRNVRAGRLHFTTDLPEAVRASEVIFIAVGTPSGPNGEADLTYVREAAAEIAEAMPGYRVIVNKSTVPVGTTDLVAGILAERTPFPFDVVANPEFLREGAAVEDCLHPDRIVIGAYTERAFECMREVYQTFDCPRLETDPRSAEMIKYASNAFLATKISFINEIANLCDRLGADIAKVAEGMGLDPRIGPAFLKAGLGFGGSCFPKDTLALIHNARRVDYELKIVPAAVEVNRLQRLRVLAKLENQLGSLQGKRIGLLGLAFKPHTDDVRESPAIDLIEHIRVRGGRVVAWDPQAMPAMQRHLAGSEAAAAVEYGESVYDVFKGAHGVLIVTDWPEFARLDWQRAGELMASRVIVDGRNLLDPKQMRNLGFVYAGVGRGVVLPDRGGAEHKVRALASVPQPAAASRGRAAQAKGRVAAGSGAPGESLAEESETRAVAETAAAGGDE